MEFPILQHNHVCGISLAHAQERLNGLNVGLGTALTELASRSSHTEVRRSARLYIATYRYGELSMGSRVLSNKDDLMGGFLPPCGNGPNVCRGCQTLSRAFGDERPLYIVLNHVIEEFLEAQEESLQRGDAVPLATNRLVRAGQFVSLAETLNSLVDPLYPKGSFKAPVRKASAGVRSAWLTALIKDRGLKLRLRAMWEEYIGKESVEPSFWATEWEDHHYLRASAEIGLAKTKSDWSVQVIVMSHSWLRDNLYSRGVLKTEAESFLRQLLELGWKESRGLRSESIRKVAISEAAQGAVGNTKADQIVNRLLLVLRGDAPGFRPAILSDENLPIRAIWETLLGDQEISERFFSDKFPGIIEPFHLNRRASIPKGTFFYYPLTSFEQLGYSNPRHELKTIDAVNDVLMALRNKNPEMLGRIRWDFFASPAPVNKRNNKEKNDAGESKRKRSVLVPFTSAETSEIIRTDFAVQMKSARDLGFPVASQLLSQPPRKGFLRRFIRVSFE